MPRNLDMTALRALVTVADAGGVTRAAGFLNLTQSAVSMQLKRLEESLGLTLLDRSGRGIGLTAEGEQLLGYGRRILALNDELIDRMTGNAFEGEVVLGVPHDIVYPHIPSVLQRFAADYPRVKVNLISSYTRRLLPLFERGECDLILTTENGCGQGGQTMASTPLVWIGAPGGTAWRSRPIRLAFEHACLLRSAAQAALDRAGVPWEMAVESESSRTVEASVTADLAVYACLEGCEPPHLERVSDGGALPELPSFDINIYESDAASLPARDLGALIRQAYAA